MPLLTAFWNVTLGTSSPATKANVFQGWSRAMNLDLLFLEEASFDEANPNYYANLTQMEILSCAYTLNTNDEPCPKMLYALQRPGLGWQARFLTFPGLDQRRGLVKATDGTIEVWVIHANASRTGGAAAVEAAAQHLASPAGAGAIVGGDFNCPIVPAGVHPHAHDGTNLRFTQWAKQMPVTAWTVPPAGMPEFHLNLPDTTPKYWRPQPHRVIDYVVCGPNRTAAAVANCDTEARWFEILFWFDHCPVVYNIA
jgi:hypothetical protein